MDATAPATRLPVGRILSVTAGVLVLVVQLVYWLPNHATRDASSTDVPAYYNAAAHVLAGEPLYAEAMQHVQGGTAVYIYPPPFAVVTAPLALLGPRPFQVAWYFVILAAFWAYAAALVRVAGMSLSVERVLVAGALLQFFPGTSTTMSFGNADLLIWALCAAALAPGGARWAGIGAALKVFPGWVLLTKRPADAARGALVGAGVLGASLIVVGPGALLDWLHVLGRIGSATNWPTNVSLPRLLGAGRIAPLFVLVGVPLVAFLMRRRAPEVAGAAVVVAALFLAPVCWVHYAPVLLMPMAALVKGRAAV